MIGPSVYAKLILEQATISGANAIFIFLAARAMPEHDFAQFSFGLTIYLVGSAVYDAGFVEPMIVLRDSGTERYKSYVGALWSLQIGLATMLITAGLAIWWLFTGFLISGLSLGAALLACATWSSFVRRGLHVAGDINITVKAGFAYFIIFQVSASFLIFANALTYVTAVIPFASGNIAFIYICRRRLPKFASFPPGVLRDHLRYAYSAVIYSLLTNLTLNIYPFIFVRMGLEGLVGDYRLLVTMFTPFVQVFSAVSSFLTPHLVGRSPAQVDRSVKLIIVFIILSSFACAVSALPLGRIGAQILFGGRYPGVGSAAPEAFFGITLSLATSAVALWLKANRAGRSIQLIGLTSFAGTIIFALPLVTLYGLSGAYLSYCLVNLISLTVAVVSVRSVLACQTK